MEMCPLSLSKATFLMLALTLALLGQHDVVLVRGDLTFVSTYCESKSDNYTEGDAFQENLGQVLGNLTGDASGSGDTFSNFTVGSGVDQVFGLYYCNGAMEASDCSACVEAAAAKIQDSCATKEAIAWYLECTLRYANSDIFSTEDVSPYAYLNLNQTVSDMTTFADVLNTTLVGVITEASFNTTSQPVAYAATQAEVSSTESLVALAQCTPDIVGSACSDCLVAAVTDMSSCCSDTVGAMVFLPSCQLLYAISYSDSATAPTSDSTTPPSSTRSPSGFPFSTSTSTPSTANSPPSKSNGKLTKSKGSVLGSRGNAFAGILTAIGFLIFMSKHIIH